MRHGALAEYVSAGSIDDEELRAHPHFTNAEAEIGREMIVTLRPAAQLMLDTMRRIRARSEARR